MSKNSTAPRDASSIRRGASRYRMAAKRGLAGCPSIFANDPNEITQDEAQAVVDPSLSTEALESSVVDTINTETAADRAATFEGMTITAKADVTVVPPLLVSNATIQLNPVTRYIPASILNYNFLRCLTDYASIGQSLWNTAEPIQGQATEVHISTVPDTDQGPNPGYKSIPAIKFTISASILNAQPGAHYNVWMQGTNVARRQIVTPRYTFERIDYYIAIQAYFIPFIIIESRTVPQLLLYGADIDGTNDLYASLFIEGMSPAEKVNVIVPGYATNFTRDISELYALPAGVLVK